MRHMEWQKQNIWHSTVPSPSLCLWSGWVYTRDIVLLFVRRLVSSPLWCLYNHCTATLAKKAHSAILSREFRRCWFPLHFCQKLYLSKTWLHRWKFRKESSSFSTRYVWSSTISQQMVVTLFSRQIDFMICTWKRNLKCAAGHEVWLILELTSDILSSHYSHAAGVRLQVPSQWTLRSRRRDQSEKRLHL